MNTNKYYTNSCSSSDSCSFIVSETHSKYTYTYVCRFQLKTCAWWQNGKFFKFPDFEIVKVIGLYECHWKTA